MPALTLRKPNFLRIGCPTECLIHIPHYVAVLKKNASRNLAVSNISIKDIIDYESTEKFQEIAKPVDKVNNLFDSINIPISSFSEIKLPSNYFTLDSAKQTEEQEYQYKIRQKLQNENYLKALSPEYKNIRDQVIAHSTYKFENSTSPYLQDPKKYSPSPRK